MTNSDARVAVVTGAASGIGWAIASQLATDGFVVVLVDRAASVHERAAALPGSAVAIEADLTDPAALGRVIDAIRGGRGRCDVLVNNAGLNLKRDGRPLTLQSTRDEDWQYSFALNLFAPFALCRGLLPLMQQRGWGRVINIASRAARNHAPSAGVAYSASKSGLVSLTRSVAAEYGPHGVTANCIAPGRIATPATALFSNDFRQSAVKDSLVGRVGEPIEIAAAARMLWGEHSGFVNGAIIDVTGGAFMPS